MTMRGKDSEGKYRIIQVDSSGRMISADINNGTKISTLNDIPSGGSGLTGWLSWIVSKLVFPTALSSSGGFKVSITGSSYRNIAGAATTNVKSGSGTLKRITINTIASLAGSAVVFDSLTGTGSKIGTIDLTGVKATLNFDVNFTNGLTIVTSALSDITVIYE